MSYQGENDMTIDEKIRPRRRVSVSKDSHQEVEDWTLFDPWEEPSKSSARSLPRRSSGIL